MLTARLHGPRDIRLEETTVPVPGRDEVLLNVTAVGLCGSDRHWFEDAAIGGIPLDRPLVLGHEIAAMIAEGPEAGVRVVVEPAIPCEACPTCMSGRRELCPTAGFAGFGPTDGALRDSMPWPRRLLRPIPSAIPDAEASTLEALGIALHAVHLAAIVSTSRVAVIGCGPIGLLVIRALVASGVTDILACDPLPHRLAAARAAGATVLAGEVPPSSAVVDVAIECAGEDAAVDTAIEMARPGGRVILVGIPGSDRTSFAASVARRKGLTLVLCRRMRPDDLGRAIDLVAAGTIDVAPLITHRYPLEDVGEAFRALADRRGLKVVVEPRQRAGRPA
jgi:L-iditol 2-dehydrogenase